MFIIGSLLVLLITNICEVYSVGYIFGNGYNFILREIYSSGAPVDKTSEPKEKWIEQPIDHFNMSETYRWEMRYFERLDYWKDGGPIYLFMYGEGPANSVFLKTGVVYDLAKETNGAMFLSEHRYYGKSIPYDNLSTKNLRFLSARQALADNARLLEFLKSFSQFKESKIVVVGGSYAGNLAAWMKLLYPELVHAAIASSAPVLAKYNFFEYLEKVADNYEQYGSETCNIEISRIFNRYNRLFQTKEGIEQLKKEEDICEDNDMSISLNRQMFFLDKVSDFMVVSQYGTVHRIHQHCEYILNSSNTRSYQRDESSDFWSKEDNCYNYDFDDIIYYTKKIKWLHAWTYQTCTEYGYFQTSNSNAHPFTDNIHLELFDKLCTMTFGPEFDSQSIQKAIQNTNKLYKGINLDVKNVVFTNGDMDPWSTLGVLEDVDYDAPATVIAQASHCRDLFSDSKNDPEELKEARKYIKYLIKRWIGVEEYQLIKIQRP